MVGNNSFDIAWNLGRGCVCSRQSNDGSSASDGRKSKVESITNTILTINNNYRYRRCR